jgi:predicted CoA-binding protein
MNESNCFERFFQSPSFAVVDAAKNREKFGNKVLRCYLQHGKIVYPVNPRAEEIEGISCCASIADLPETVYSISVITPPAVTGQVVQEAIKKGIKNIWMQPGAESPVAVEACRLAGISVIADQSCLLQVLGFDANWAPPQGVCER